MFKNSKNFKKSEKNLKISKNPKMLKISKISKKLKNPKIQKKNLPNIQQPLLKFFLYQRQEEINEWIKENYQLLHTKIPNLEELTYKDLIKIIESDIIYEEDKKLQEEKEEEERRAAHEFTYKEQREREILEEMKKDLIEMYVEEDEIEKKEKMILREIEKVQNKGIN